MSSRPKRININLLNDELRDLINASSKIFPVDESYIQNNTNPEGYEYVRILEGTLRNNIYIWRKSAEQWELIGADDKEVYWYEILEKPTTYPPSPHNHDERYYTKEEADNSLASLDSSLTGQINSLEEYLDLNIDLVNNSLSAKVDKVEGKGLSTNDFTDELKLRLESLSDNASVDYAEMANQLEQHKLDSVVHTTQLEKDKWNTIDSKADKTYVDNQLSSKVNNSTFQGHTDNLTIHVTQTKKDEWDAKETPAGAQAKADQAEANAKNYVDEQLAGFESSEITIGTTQPDTKMWYKVVG